MTIFDKISTHDLVHVVFTLSPYTTVSSAVLFLLCSKYKSFDIALKVAELSAAEKRDPLSYSLDEALGKILDDTINELEEKCST